MVENILNGFASVFEFGPSLVILVGGIIGMLVGAIPGISAIVARSIMQPITCYMDPVSGICMLLAVYKAGIYGGSISAILIKTPGAAASFLTAQDGHALTLKGKAGKALDTSLFASVTGEALATLVLILVAAPFSVLSIKSGSIDQLFLLIFAYTVIGTMAGKSIPKGLISCC